MSDRNVCGVVRSGDFICIEAFNIWLHVHRAANLAAALLKALSEGTEVIPAGQFSSVLTTCAAIAHLNEGRGVR